ncbi:MAG: hypothetical protein IJX99_07210 [Clostridia bacterium]|nr:hypothetical protein [Clostridia bacterium]
MKTLYIFTSVNNIYTGQVAKIVKESKIDTKVINIEDLVENANKYKFEKEDVAYFLCCNSLLIKDAIEILNQYGCTIINYDYLKCDYKKLDIQKLLQENDVLIPEICQTNNLDNLTFPLFCKENKHEGIIFQVYNKITLEKFFERFDIENFYFEEVIIANDSVGEEIKLYFVNGEIFGKKDSIIIDDALKTMCLNVSKALNDLEVFSVDIIKTKENKSYVIDVNPSAGFYLSDQGRACFLNQIYNK